MRQSARALLAATLALCAPAQAEPSFEVLATFPQTAFLDVRISADGAVATIGTLDLGLGGGALRKVIATGASMLLALGMGATAFPSADGSVVMGNEYQATSSVYRWTSTSRVIVPTLFGQIGALAADGMHYTGAESLAFVPQGYVATYAPGTPVLTMLGDLPGGAVTSEPRGISGDGAIVVGKSAQTLGPEAFRWDAVNGMVGLGDLEGGAFSSDANDVSQDGTTIVGHSTSTSGTEAFVWQDGEMVGLGDLPGGTFESRALGVSADGSIVVGSGRKLAGEAAFVRDRQGVHDLETLLVDGYGLDLEGAKLHGATGVSADGYTIVGHGLDGTQRITWVAVIPEPDASSGLVAGLLALAGLSRRRASAGSPRG
jgi:probable HAF family extracellular repeat protein